MRILLGIVCGCLYALTAICQDQTLYLNPENAPGIKASAIVEKTAFIPLEKVTGAIVGTNSALTVTKGYFVFLNHDTGDILIFDKQGKFVHKYKKKKYKINGLQYIPSKNALFLVSQNKNYTIPLQKKQQMIQHPNNRNFKKYVNLELLSLEPGFSIEALPVSQYALAESFWWNGNLLIQNKNYNKYLKDTVAYHIMEVKDQSVQRSWFPFLNLPRLAPYYQDISFSMTLSPDDRSIFITKEFDNTIYRLTEDSLFAAYRFVFPASITMPGDFQSTEFRNNIEFTNYKNKNKKVIRTINGIVEYGQYLLFSASDLEYSNKRYLFYKPQNMLYSLNKLTTDSSMYFLPPRMLFDNDVEKGTVYSWLSADNIIKDKQNLLTKNKVLPEAFKTYLDRVNKFDNPVIVGIKLKPEIAAK